MPVLTIRSEDRRTTTTLTLVEAPSASVPSSDWCLAVEVHAPDFLGRNADVYFLREDAAAFLLQLRALEASRAGTARLRSIGEGSDAQEFEFSLSASRPTRPLMAEADVVKLRWHGGVYTPNRCRITYEVDQGDLLQILRDAEGLFEGRCGE